MKKLILSMVFCSLLFSSCSKEENNDSPNTEPELPELQKKYLFQVTGDDDTEFAYEDGLLVRGIDRIDGLIFQVEYGSNGKVDRVYEYYTWPPATDINFDIPSDYEGQYYETYIYEYEDGKLSQVVSTEGMPLMKFTYDSEGRVIQYSESEGYSENYDNYYVFDYVYGDSGRVERYVNTETHYDYTASGKIETDDKINPLYIYWQEYSLIVPGVTEIAVYNLPFIPNNVTKVYNGEELDLHADLSYKDDYPVFYENMKSLGGPTVIEYIE